MIRILLVEDHEGSRDMLSRRLRRAGYQVIEAADGVTGLDLALSLHPDVVLLDLGLPGMDGFEVTRRLKRSPDTQDIPILVVTAYSRSDGEALARAAGCDDYEPKPVRFRRLVEKIALHTGQLAATA